MSEVEKALVAGILIGEGSPTCRGRYRGGKIIGSFPVVTIGMCDKKAVEKVAHIFDTKVTQSKAIHCKPTPQNPKGTLSITATSGKPAQAIMKNLEPYIKETDLHAKWLRTLEKCPTKPRPKKCRAYRTRKRIKAQKK